jgi:hypothetical protein
MANKPAAGNAGFAPRLTIGRHRPGVPAPPRSACIESAERERRLKWPFVMMGDVANGASNPWRSDSGEWQRRGRRSGDRMGRHRRGCRVLFGGSSRGWRLGRRVGPEVPDMGWKGAEARLARHAGRQTAACAMCPRVPHSCAVSPSLGRATSRPPPWTPQQATGRVPFAPRVSTEPPEARVAPSVPRSTPAPRWSPDHLCPQGPSLGPRDQIQSP